MLSAKAPIDEILNELCNFIDFRSPEVIPTVLLPGRDGKYLRLAAGPKVAKVWNEAFDGLKVPAFARFEPTMLKENPIMRERAEELSGHLEIERSEHGTKVKATIPGRNFRTAALR